MIKPEQAGEVIGVFGPVASGKTYLLKQWFQEMSHALVFDPSDEYTLADSNEHIYAEPTKLIKALEKGLDGFRIVYHPIDLPAGFGWCAQALWQLDMPRWFIVEECHEVASEVMFQNCIRYGRKRAALGTICSSQRIQDVPKILTDSMRMVVLFYTEDARSRQAIRERWGEEVEQAVGSLRSLIYSESAGTSQTPEALVVRRGQGWEKVEL